MEGQFIGSTILGLEESVTRAEDKAKPNRITIADATGDSNAEPGVHIDAETAKFYRRGQMPRMFTDGDNLKSFWIARDLSSHKEDFTAHFFGVLSCYVDPRTWKYALEQTEANLRKR